MSDKTLNIQIRLIDSGIQQQARALASSIAGAFTFSVPSLHKFKNELAEVKKELAEIKQLGRGGGSGSGTGDVGFGKLHQEIGRLKAEVDSLTSALNKAQAEMSKLQGGGGRSYGKITAAQATARVDTNISNEGLLLDAKGGRIEDLALLAKRRQSLRDEIRRLSAQTDAELDADVRARLAKEIQRREAELRAMRENEQKLIDQQKRMNEERRRIRQAAKAEEDAAASSLRARVDRALKNFELELQSGRSLDAINAAFKNWNSNVMSKGGADRLSFITPADHRALKEFELSSVSAQGKLRDLGLAVSETRGHFDRFMTTVKQYAQFQLSFYAGMAAIFTAFRTMSELMGEGVQYAQTLKDIQAIGGSGAGIMTNAQIEAFSAAAMTVARSTPLASDAVAKLGLQMIRAGLDADEAAAAMGTVAKVATISGEDTKTVADTFATAMKAWKMEAKDAEQVGNILAIAMNKSRLTVQDLGTAYNYLAGVAVSMNLSFKETNALLAVMSNQGVRASTIATGITQLFSEFASPSRQLARFLHERKADTTKLNLMMSTAPEDQKIITFMQELERIGFKTGEAFEFLDVRAKRAFAFLRNAGVEGKGGLKEMINAMNDQGALNRSFEISMEGPINAFKQLWNSASQFALILANAFTPAIRTLSSALSLAGDGLKVLVTLFLHIGPLLAFMAAIRQVILLVEAYQVAAAKAAASNVAVGVSTAAAGFTALGTSVTTATTAIRAFLGAMGPIGWAITGLSVLMSLGIGERIFGDSAEKKMKSAQDALKDMERDTKGAIRAFLEAEDAAGGAGKAAVDYFKEVEIEHMVEGLSRAVDKWTEVGSEIDVAANSAVAARAESEQLRDELNQRLAADGWFAEFSAFFQPGVAKSIGAQKDAVRDLRKELEKPLSPEQQAAVDRARAAASGAIREVSQKADEYVKLSPQEQRARAEAAMERDLQQYYLGMEKARAERLALEAKGVTSGGAYGLAKTQEEEFAGKIKKQKELSIQQLIRFRQQEEKQSARDAQKLSSEANKEWRFDHEISKIQLKLRREQLNQLKEDGETELKILKLKQERGLSSAEEYYAEQERIAKDYLNRELELISKGIEDMEREWLDLRRRKSGRELEKVDAEYRKNLLAEEGRAQKLLNEERVRTETVINEKLTRQYQLKTATLQAEQNALSISKEISTVYAELAEISFDWREANRMRVEALKVEQEILRTNLALRRAEIDESLRKLKPGSESDAQIKALKRSRELLGAETEAKEKLIKKRIELLELERNGSVWQGIAYGAQELSDNLKGEFAAGRDFIKGVTDSMSSAFDQFFDHTSENFMKFGKLAEQVLNSIAREILRVLILKPLIGAITSGISGIFGGMFGGGGNSGMVLNDFLDRAHTGGHVTAAGIIPRYHIGGLAKDEVPAILQTGEYVVSRKGVAALEKLNRGEVAGSGDTTVNIVVNNKTGLPFNLKQTGQQVDERTKFKTLYLELIQSDPDFKRMR